MSPHTPGLRNLDEDEDAFPLLPDWLYSLLPPVWIFPTDLGLHPESLPGVDGI